MRRTTVTALAAALVLAPTVALALPFTGTLTVQYASDTLPALSVSGSGTSTDGPAGAFTLAAGAFAGNDLEETLDAAPVIVQIELENVSSGAGSFAGGSGSMAVGGNLLHYFFQPLPNQAIPIPLGDVGVGGTSPINVVLGTGAVSGSITGDTWTTGAITVVGANTLNASGFDNRLLDGTGAIRFVTPIEVVLTIGLDSIDVAAYAQLDLLFTAAVPEPGALALVAAGVTLLLGVRRPRSA
jgi:hypothetical protein